MQRFCVCWKLLAYYKNIVFFNYIIFLHALWLSLLFCSASFSLHWFSTNQPFNTQATIINHRSLLQTFVTVLADVYSLSQKVVEHSRSTVLPNNTTLEHLNLIVDSLQEDPDSNSEGGTNSHISWTTVRLPACVHSIPFQLNYFKTHYYYQIY